MAETKTQLKRLREEQVEEEIEETKRQRPYHHILSILEDEEEESYQDDLSSLMTTLQHELSSSSEPDSSSDPSPQTTATPLEASLINPPTTITSGNIEPNSNEEGEEKGSTIIRHLLEASDDELGIPQTQIRLQTKYEDEDINIIHGAGIYPGSTNYNGEGAGAAISLFDNFHDGFWDFEDFDQTSHYYSLSQSELFM